MALIFLVRDDEVDAKARALVDNFAMQWLQLRRLQAFAPDTKLFPSFSDSLRAAMMRETELFIGEIIREDRSVLDLIDGNFTYLNETLARHYGIGVSARGQAGEGVRNWGAEDYKPLFEVAGE